jgi:hypothetical protein
VVQSKLIKYLFIDLYGENIMEMPLALDACTYLLSSLEEEEQLTMKLLELQGAMEMLQTASVSQKYLPAPITIDLDASGNEVQMEV